MNRFDYSRIPEHMMESLQYYVKNHYVVGGFLEAVISNDLAKAVSRADDTNLELIPVYVCWFTNKAPMSCWGSKEKYLDWIKRKEVSSD